MWQISALDLSSWYDSPLLTIPSWGALSFQNAASPLIEQLILFHDHTITILALIVSIVGFNIYTLLSNPLINKTLTESQPIELFWTITPAVILVFIGLPSIKLLYLLDEVFNPAVTIKTVGHQWYWTYEMSDFLNLEFDSYLINSPNEIPRLLQTDNHTIIPIKTQIRNLITAADVLHSWTIPSLGVKVDAIPGRLNQVNFFSSHPGIIFGQCSEICGANHRFIPISIESVTPKSFIKWVKSIK